MQPRAFLTSLPDVVRSLVPKDIRDFTARSGFSLIKLIYGNPKLHYEANHQLRSQTVEVGLHFEADEFTNARLLGAFRMQERAIRRELPGAQFEEWDKSWTRIWEPVAYQQLDRDLQREVAERLARYITMLEPVLREVLPADVPWDLKPQRRPRAGGATRTRSSGRPRRAPGARGASGRRV